MRARRRGPSIPGHPRAALVAVVTGVGLLGAYAVACEWAPGWEWAIAGAGLAAVGVMHARFALSWSRRTEELIAMLRAVADGDSLDGAPEGADQSAVRSSAGLYGSVRELVESIRDLRQNRRRAELVLANMADGIVAVDTDRRVTLLNRAASLIFHDAPAGVVGGRLEDVDLHPEVTRLVDECIASRRDALSEIKLPGWPQRVISIRATPFCSGGGLADSAVVILRDLTEARRHEQNQREFVSNVSHELRTPITAVRTTAEALLAGAKNDESVVDRFLNNILSESDRLSALIEDLMEIARMDAGIAMEEMADVDVAHLVNRALDAVRPQAATKNISIEVRVEDGLTVRCNELQAVQVIRNLADNAVKYSPDEGGEVVISGRRVETGVAITVQDSGMGIPHGEIDRIFERFYRVDKARSRRLGGTGLGLAIVKEIVNAHGGTITVDTQLGKGSTFCVTLPDGPEPSGTG